MILRMNLYELSNAQSYASLHYIRSVNVPYLKPIALSTPSHFHRRSKKHTLPHYIFGDIEMRQAKQRGIVFEWPQKRKFYSEKELCFVGWIIAHALFWLHVTHILPSGAALGLKQPPWKYKPRIPKPENRDYIIEPDWDSCYL